MIKFKGVNTMTYENKTSLPSMLIILNTITNKTFDTTVQPNGIVDLAEFLTIMEIIEL